MRGKFNAWLQHCWLRFLTLFRRSEASQRFDDEIQFHIEQQIAENLAVGMNPAAAREAALRLFGNRASIQEHTRDTWGWLRLEELARNFRRSARTLGRAPAFTLLAILIIAVGIGANVSLFTVVRAVLLQPLPYKDSARLLSLYESFSGPNWTYDVVAGGVYSTWKKESHGFSDMAVALTWPEYNLSGGAGQLPERVHATEVSSDFFETLGVAPAIGRGFSPSDDQPSANATVILSWGLWKRRFGGDPSILGEVVRLDAKPYTVIGVMPQSFAYPDHTIQLWTPVHREQFELYPKRWEQVDSHMFTVIGRLKPGVTAAQATAELSAISYGLHQDHADNAFIADTARSRPLLEDMVGDFSAPLYALFAATGCLLLIACLNVAGLLVGRGTARRRELAVRTALGATRWRLLAEHLTETLVLSAAGGAAGLLMAYAVIQWFTAERQDMARVESIRMDPVVIAFGMALAFLCALAAGAISAISIQGDHAITALQESSRVHGGSRGGVRLRRWLLALQVCFTVVLLIGAGLLLKSYARLRATNLGCSTANILTMHVNLPPAKYAQGGERLSFWQSLLQRVESLPGVESVALGDFVPGGGYGWDNSFSFYQFTLPGQPTPPPGEGMSALVRFVDGAYFQTLGIPLLRGQFFDGDQQPDHARKVIVSESFVRQFLPGENPLGKQLHTLNNLNFEIVGVVRDTRYDVAKPSKPTMYFKALEANTTNATLVVRSAGDVTPLAMPIQRIAQELDPDLPLSDILTMQQMIGQSTLDESFDASLLLAFAALSLLLAGVGLFGVLSYVVAQRTTEIGIRMALGAQRGEVLWRTLIDGLKPAGAGLLAGLAVAVGATRLIQKLLYGVAPLDAAVFAGVAFVLLGVASVACLVPAWRASRLDPLQALRNE
jgi:predicted permease